MIRKKMKKVSYTEVSLGEALQHEHRIKVNDFVGVLKQKGEIKTNLIEIFPGLEVEFVIRKIAETCIVDNVQYQYPSGNDYVYNQNNKQQPKNPGDLLFFIEIQKGKNKADEDAQLAGAVRMTLGGKVDTMKFGNVEKDVYKAFTKGVIVIDSGNYLRRNNHFTGNQETFPGVFSYNTEEGWQDDPVSLELVFSLHHPGLLIRSQEVAVPKSLRSQETLPAITKSIMLDEETADLTLRCDTKAFRVHKNFLCSRSPVFRDMIFTDMKEARKGEIYIEDVDEGTLASMINFIYTGELSTDNLNIQMVTNMADKYNMPALSDLLCFKMKSEDVSSEFVADLLISADRHDSQDLKNVALDKLRADREIINDPGFKRKLQNAENKNIIFDIFNELNL